jgi:hypothetical protein
VTIPTWMPRSCSGCSRSAAGLTRSGGMAMCRPVPIIALSGGMYFRSVLRSTPRLWAISFFDRPACQCMRISVTHPRPCQNRRCAPGARNVTSDQSELPGPADGLAAASRRQLAVDVLEVCLDVWSEMRISLAISGLLSKPETCCRTSRSRSVSGMTTTIVAWSRICGGAGRWSWRRVGASRRYRQPAQGFLEPRRLSHAPPMPSGTIALRAGTGSNPPLMVKTGRHPSRSPSSRARVTA